MASKSCKSWAVYLNKYIVDSEKPKCIFDSYNFFGSRGLLQRRTHLRKQINFTYNI